MGGEEPPIRLIEWICTTFEGFCPARDVVAALEAAWNRRAAPGKKNAPRTWKWFYSTLRNALIPGESARLPERPAAPHPDHSAKPAALRSGIEAVELADALVPSWSPFDAPSAGAVLYRAIPTAPLRAADAETSAIQDLVECRQSVPKAPRLLPVPQIV
jgi:hypothetical protein